mmetsp:Transcript_37585/g.69294  ORF Transcript_37585/g.69294 Transcript_37585/m.69294 type:complete len:326 (-) Transcript_37585:322-1299(-)
MLSGLQRATDDRPCSSVPHAKRRRIAQDNIERHGRPLERKKSHIVVANRTLFCILSFLGPRDLAKALAVNREWRRAGEDERLWKRHCLWRWRSSRHILKRIHNYCQFFRGRAIASLPPRPIEHAFTEQQALKQLEKYWLLIDLYLESSVTPFASAASPMRNQVGAWGSDSEVPIEHCGTILPRTTERLNGRLPRLLTAAISPIAHDGFQMEISVFRSTDSRTACLIHRTTQASQETSLSVNSWEPLNRIKCMAMPGRNSHRGFLVDAFARWTAKVVEEKVVMKVEGVGIVFSSDSLDRRANPRDSDDFFRSGIDLQFSNAHLEWM